MAGHARLPLLLVELPSCVELLLDFLTCRWEQVLLELVEGHLAIALLRIRESMEHVRENVSTKRVSIDIQVLYARFDPSGRPYVSVKSIKHLLVDFHLLTRALFEAQRPKGALKLAHVEDAVTVGVELGKYAGQIPLAGWWRRHKEACAVVQQPPGKGVGQGGALTVRLDGRLADGRRL